MKQHITVEQLNELTPKLRVKLNDTWRNNGQEVNLLSYEDISIGQMIEFLDSIAYKEKSIWDMMMFHDSFSGIKASDVCDKLWEAVKEILEK